MITEHLGGISGIRGGIERLCYFSQDVYKPAVGERPKHTRHLVNKKEVNVGLS